MEDLCDLLFEVSNEDRLKLIRVLRGRDQNVTGLARDLGITTQEVSRHLSRLGDVGLTEKDPDGSYRLTPYGELILKQIKGVEFTSGHRDYFIDRSLRGLPEEFVNRLGELSRSDYMDDIMVVVHNVERVIREADEYLWDLNLPYIASAFPEIRRAFERGVKGRFIHGENLSLPEEMEDDRRETLDYDFTTSMMRAGVYQERLIDTSPIIYMSEREVALVTFPRRDGRHDFYGFTSTDEATLKWCSDLFLYHWERSKPLNKSS
ncbi:MAG: ArsR family transcriptional regulator [Candidatus Bathyarchaeota archaeon]